nr:autoinducer binding domain-containing protein [Falsirhodobacter deserti]
MAVQGYCVGLHFRRSVPLARFSTLNSVWMEHYTNKGFVLRDPCLGWACSNNGVVRWSDRRLIDPYGVFPEAKRFGLNFGAVACEGPVTSMSVGVIARSDREFTDAELQHLFRTIRTLHCLVSPPDRLTLSQIEALRVVSSGNRYAGAAAQLGISESALKARLYSARERLLARTTPEAIRRAKEIGLI